MAIINKDKETVIFDPEEKDREKTLERTNLILEIIKGNKPPLKLVSTCKSSPWYKKCVSEAEEKNDIALIYRLDGRSHPALRECGINTVKDAAQMDVGLLPKIPQCPRETLDRIKLQAQSLVDGELKWLTKPQMPTADLKLFFDIEGDPLF
jgi:predicted RecB family nuclease